MKIKFKHRADNYFWVTALLIFIVGMAMTLLGDDYIVVNVHDTYYVMNRFQFVLYLSALYFLLGFIYWCMYRLQLKTYPAFTKLHTKATTGIIFIYLIATPFLYFFDSGIFSHDYAEKLLFVLFGLFILAQPLLIINIIIGLVRGHENKE